MTRTGFDASPQGYARLAGAIYLLVIVFGMFSEGFVMNKVVVSGDVAATARNILASGDLWRISVAGNLLAPLIAVVQLWIEYLIFRPAGRNAALLFLLFNATSLAVEAVSKVFLLMVAPALAGAGYARALDPKQLYEWVGFALSAHNITFDVALVLFGCACLVSGHLIFRSQYLPRFIGVMMQVAGASYLVACFSELFAPAFAEVITPWILIPPLIGEGALCLWLLVMGVNVETWRARLASGERT